MLREAAGDGATGRTAKLYEWGTHRAVAPGLTAARVSAVAEALGITRVANLTGLDVIGIPVTAVIRPASRNLSVSQGKGLTLDAAQASGLMEALECFCAETIKGRTIWADASFGDRAQAVWPSRMLARNPPPGLALPWVPSMDMMLGREVWLPAELVFADFSHPAPPGLGYFRASTNGLASGNSREEALLHGLCELIERDAVSLWQALRQEGHRAPYLDCDSIAAPAARHAIDLVEASGLSLAIWDVTSDIAVPCFFCIINDGDSPSAISIGNVSGAGCHPSADVALCRAVTEAAQARLTLIAGSRDDIDMSVYEAMRFNRLLSRLFSGSATTGQEIFEDRSTDGPSIADDLSAVLCLLAARNVDGVYYSELPCPLDTVSCVRVVAPQLEASHAIPGLAPGLRAEARIGEMA
jgi:YcaO-like protein with predicted kinase domain